MDSNDEDLHFFPHPLSPFTECPIDNLLQAIFEPSNQQKPIAKSQSFDQVSLSSSPPSIELQNLTLRQNSTHLPNMGNGFSGLTSLDDVLDVKAEESQGVLDLCYNQNTFAPHSYSGEENMAKFLQRSYGSNTSDVRPGFCFKPQFNSLMEMIESPNFRNQTIGSAEESFFAGQMRRVFSTGDLHNMKPNCITQSHRPFSSPSAAEGFYLEEANFKVGHYSAEQRKEKIIKYRAKRSQRNFNKTIKYASRKMLADNRPRIRGRFARNDEVGEIPKAACSISTRGKDEDEVWLDGFHEETGGALDGQF